MIGIADGDGPPALLAVPARRPATAGEVHLAFAAPDRAAVDAVHAAAVAAGFEVLHAPRVFPEYHPGYYGTFLRDPDGNNAEAVHHTVDRGASVTVAGWCPRGRDRAGQRTPTRSTTKTRVAPGLMTPPAPRSP